MTRTGRASGELAIAGLIALGGAFGVQAIAVAVSRMDADGTASARLAMYLAVAAFASTVLTLGGVTVTVDMARRGRLAREAGFFGALLAAIAIIVLVAAAVQPRPIAELAERAGASPWILATLVVSVLVAVYLGSLRSAMLHLSAMAIADRLPMSGALAFALVFASTGVVVPTVAYLATSAVAIAYSVVQAAALLRDRWRFSLEVPGVHGRAALAWNLLNAAFAYAYQYLDTMLLATRLPPAAFGTFFLMVQLSLVPRQCVILLARLMLPVAGHELVEPGPARERTMRRFEALLAALSLATVATTLAAWHWGERWLDGRFASHADVLGVLMIGTLLALPGPLVYTYLIAAGRTDRFVATNVAGGLLLVVVQCAMTLAVDDSALMLALACARLAAVGYYQVSMLRSLGAVDPAMRRRLLGSYALVAGSAAALALLLAMVIR